MGAGVNTIGLTVRLLGPVTVIRGRNSVALPQSRKVRALLALLVLDRSARTRSRIVDLLWDGPNDPRGELRWCLSKLRGVFDDEQRRRVITEGNTLVSLDLSADLVDVVEIESATRAGLAALDTAPLVELSALFGGELLEGVELDGSASFTAWLAAQRQRFRTMHIAALAELATRPDAGTFRHLERWLMLTPFDRRAHELMIRALIKQDRHHDAAEHVAKTIRAFEQEGLDWSSLREIWVAARPIAVTSAEPSRVEPRAQRRASVAIMPFVEAPASPLADGLTDDIITRLAKLRAVRVIARGTVYALNERGIDAREAGRILDVAYVASGRIRRQGARVSVLVELADADDARIVWTDELSATVDASFAAVDAISDRIVAAIAEEIETAECHRAILKPPSSLDAWEAYHRGLWHMYKFTAPSNRDAAQLFHSALALDPTFARAHAGLSFTHFQNVFLELTPDREKQIELAIATAADSVVADDRDPAAHWAVGRALWLRGEQRESIAELQRSIELSPNFALGHYTLGFVQSQSGDPRDAIQSSNHSRELSPFDPLQFGMLASRGLAHLRLGEHEEAAHWAVRAIGRPNAHAHILAIAASTLALANRRDDAKKLVARIRERLPTYNVESFLRAFRFERDTEQLLRRGARTFGFAR